jgi:hypothetical protein
MNASLLNETDFLHRLRVEWEQWKTHEKYHPNRVLWWDSYAKRIIWLAFQREGSERRRDHANMENFYYTVIYQALKALINHAKKATILKHLKAKIARPHSHQQQRILLDNDNSDGLMGEEVSLHQHITALKRKKAQTVTQIQNRERIIQTTSMAILRTFTDHLRRKYDHIPSSDESIRQMLDCGLKKLPSIAANILEEPKTLEELRTAMATGKARKAPGCDGISHEFFKITWR